MKIVFDGRWLGRTGIGRYCSELLEQLQMLDHTNQYVVLLLPDQFKDWQPTNPNFSAVRTTHEVYTWQEQLLLPWQIRQLKPDLVHFTNFNYPIMYLGRFVVTIHDLTLIKFKNIRGAGLKKILYELKYQAMKLALYMAAHRATQVIVPVEYVKDGLLDRYGIAGTKVAVTPEAVNDTFAEPEPLHQLELPEQFLLYVGNYYPYKNVGRLAEAFAKTTARKRGIKLVLCGKATYFQDQVRTHVRELGVTSDVIFTGYLSDGQLSTLYRDARLFVFPSLSEGFGLPGLEAMAQGTPVLAARASCLPEVYAEAAAYFDPLDIDDMARQIDALLNNEPRLQQLSLAGRERITHFSWRRLAEQTLAIYSG